MAKWLNKIRSTKALCILESTIKFIESIWFPLSQPALTSEKQRFLSLPTVLYPPYPPGVLSPTPTCGLPSLCRTLTSPRPKDACGPCATFHTVAHCSTLHFPPNVVNHCLPATRIRTDNLILHMMEKSFQSSLSYAVNPARPLCSSFLLDSSLHLVK